MSFSECKLMRSPINRFTIDCHALAAHRHNEQCTQLISVPIEDNKLGSIHNLHNFTIVATIHNYKQKIYNFLFVKTIVCKSYTCNYNYLSTIICNYNCRNRFYKSTITIYKRET